MKEAAELTPLWDERYAVEAVRLAEKYFGPSRNFSSLFPCARDHYPWASHRPDVSDSRVPAKNNTEYHGLERHAGQYHAVAMYEEASHFWLLAAWHRQADMDTHNFVDDGHKAAVSFCLRNMSYNAALKAWSDAGGSQNTPPPKPELFGVKPDQLARIEAEAETTLRNYGTSTDV